LDCKVQETSQSTSAQIKAFHVKLADAQSQHVEALRQREQRLQHAGSRPTATEARCARMAKEQSKQTQREMDVMLGQLHNKIRETSDHTSEQIQALYEILHHATVQQETVHTQALAKLQQQLRDQEHSSKDHLDAIVLKYLQTEENLEQELSTTRERLEDQLHLVKEWEHKYKQLHTNVVSPAEAQTVLDKIQTLNTQLQADATPRLGKTENVVPTLSKISLVHQEIIALLSKLVTKEEMTAPELDTTHPLVEMPDDLIHARHNEVAIVEELDFLKLQKQLLVDDTTKVTVEQYAEMTAKGNELYQKELAALLEAEGRRLQEIDSLEAELNHLAFLAVQVEDCERDFLHQQDMYQRALDELRVMNQSSTVKIQALQSNVQKVVETHAVKVVGKKSDAKLSAADLRIHELEQALAQRDAQLESTRLQLKLSQDRVRLLETTITSQ
jgi:hypothetical protein